MSLFKKIFGKSAEQQQAADRARAPRVQLQPLHRISFHDQGSGQKLDLSNISEGGMAVLHKGDPRFQKDGVVSGVLRIDKDEFAIEAQIRHLNMVLAGCEFRNTKGAANLESKTVSGLASNISSGFAGTRLKRTIENYLRVEILALNLRPVDPAYLKPDPRGATHWLTDGRQNEVYCVIDASGIVAFHLNFLGHYIEGARGTGVRGGVVLENVSGERPGHKASALLDMSRGLSSETLALAKSFVHNVVRSRPEMRNLLEKFLEINLGK